LKKRVLIFPSGSEVGLEAHRAISNNKHFEVFGASSISDHSKLVFKNHVYLPFIDSDEFLNEFNSFLLSKSIDLIVPVQDSVVLKLAENELKIKAKLVASPKETCKIARSKLLTYEALRDHILVPKTYTPQKGLKFPVFLKPDIGEGSKGTYLAKNVQDLNFYLKKDSSLIISEYLSGREFTVDCFTNRNGFLMYAGARERFRISNGASVNSKIIEDIKFLELAQKINSRLSFRGVWFFQVKENDNGDLVLMEIAARMPGTLALTRVHGPNLLLLSLFDRLNFDVEIVRNKQKIEIDRAFFARYILNFQMDSIYVDFDDTLVVDGKVNAFLIYFLYQSKNEGKELFLITKHKGDIYSSLNQHHIPVSLFSEVIHLKKEDQKTDFIKFKNPIFIDDSFNERKSVSEKLGIPVFDIDSIEALINWRQ
jgi:hypothetical protein